MSTYRRTSRPRTGGALAEALAPISPPEWRTHTESMVLRAVRELTADASSASITAQTPLMEAVVDSLGATELASRLHSLTGVALSPTIVFEHPTSCAITAHLLEHVTQSDAALGAGPEVTCAAASAGGPLTVTGMVGRWPRVVQPAHVFSSPWPYMEEQDQGCLSSERASGQALVTVETVPSNRKRGHG